MKNKITFQTGTTSTRGPLTQTELVEKMRYALTEYARRKWYEPRKELLKIAIEAARKFNVIEDFKYYEIKM